jgi:hypothetical protein
MLAAIELYDQRLFHAYEIHNIGCDRILTAEFPSRQTGIAKIWLKKAFGISLAFAHRPSRVDADLSTLTLALVCLYQMFFVSSS